MNLEPSLFVYFALGFASGGWAVFCLWFAGIPLLALGYREYAIPVNTLCSRSAQEQFIWVENVGQVSYDLVGAVAQEGDIEVL